MKGKDNNEKYKIFRERFSFMVYEHHEIAITSESLMLKFYFNLSDKYLFSPTIEFPNRDFFPDLRNNVHILNNLAFHIGMIELISYWKAACPPVVFIKPHNLNQQQINWWKKLYFNGLGEFFFLNGIQTGLDDFMIMKSESSQKLTKVSFPAENRTLIPIGGGKDSIVTLELLKNYTQTIPLIINPLQSQLDVLKNAGYKINQSIIIDRQIDPKLLELNKEGYLNGHTPFSAVVAFYSLLAGFLSSSKNIALSNESSANEASIPGTNINHQYSKSFEFEQDFRCYTSNYITQDCNYFSFLRPLNELQIAKLFSKQEKYFYEFKSCNAGSKQNLWCGKCPKCLFTYLILSPFIKPEVLENIFGKNLLNDPELFPVFRKLAGLTSEKPFDCVGTIREIRAAIGYTANKHRKNNSYLLEFFRQNNIYVEKGDFTELLDTFDPDNFLTPEFENILMKSLNEKDH